MLARSLCAAHRLSGWARKFKFFENGFGDDWSILQAFIQLNICRKTERGLATLPAFLNQGAPRGS
jgi:hypothetical protein